ncbi:MAG: N-6 DNA methylase [Planctomycetota bacterium]
MSRVLRSAAARLARDRGMKPVWEADLEAFPGDLAGFPPEELGILYEQLLGHEPRRSSRGWVLLPVEIDRKQAGAFYTSERLAGPTARRTVGPLLSAPDAGQLRIVDPALGCGAFLLVALRLLMDREQGAGLDGAVAISCLHGFDLDPLAVEVARLVLWIEGGDARLPLEAVSRTIRVGNGLRRGREGSFDAVIGNPPWEIVKPNSREFFSRFDPGYRRLARREAERRSEELLRRPEIASRWERYLLWHRTFSAWVRGGGRFEHQGRGDLNTYKLVLERGLRLLREGGWLGLILPSGLGFDLGAADLRAHLLSTCDWRWLFQFANRDGLFEIHRSYKFGPVVVKKGGETREIRAAFMRSDPAEWQDPEPSAFVYPREAVRRFSPGAGALLEIGSSREFLLLERIFEHSVLLGERQEIRYAREFDLTNHSRLFVDPLRLEREGWTRDRLGRLVRGESEVALPLYQGVMIQRYDCAAAEYVGGKGSRADWRALPFPAKRIRSRFAVRIEDVRRRCAASLAPRLAFRDVQNACNERTMIAALVPGFPCGNTLPTLTCGDLLTDLALLPILSSYPLDRVLRLKMSQNHVNWFVVQELPLPREIPQAVTDAMVLAAARLALVGPWFEESWRELEMQFGLPAGSAARRVALDPEERRSLQASLDAVVAWLYGLDEEDLALLLKDCDHAVAALKSARLTRSFDPKGFWRVDRDLDPNRRRTVRTLAAFRRLGKLLEAGAGPGRAVRTICDGPE